MRDLFRLVLVLTLFCAAAAAVLAGVYAVTKGPIAEAKAEEVRRAVRAVLPPYDNAADQEFVDKDLGPDKRGRPRIRRVYLARRGGVLVGRAFLVTAPDGYGGPIEIMMGVSPEERITGIEIVSHAETPGLGAKITSEETWPGKGSGPGGLVGKSLADRLAVKKDGGVIDQITGATISPRAVVRAVKQGLIWYRETFGGTAAPEGTP